MGIENRDYYRDRSYTASLASWRADFTPVVKYLIIANVAVFLLQIFITRPAMPPIPDFDGMEEEEQALRDAVASKSDKITPEERQKREEALRKARDAMEEMMTRMPGMRVSIIQEWFELDPIKTVQQGQVWRLLTCAFCHDRYGIWHIVFNMLMLYWFGTRLERMYGSREFLLFYLAAVICSSVAYLALAFYTGSKIPAIGASGGIMGVMMLYVIYYPYQTVLLCWLVPVPLWLLLGFYVLFDLHPILLALAGERLFTGVAHAGHLGGLAFGFLYWWSDVRLESIFARKWRRARLRVVRPSNANLRLHRDDDAADPIDAILEKISREGTGSLTEQERDLLKQASAKYRNKRGES